MKKRTGEAPPSGGSIQVQPKKNREHLSVSGDLHKRLKAWCAKAGIPLGPVVEIVAARAIGMPTSDLPEHVQQWVPRVESFFATA